MSIDTAARPSSGTTAFGLRREKLPWWLPPLVAAAVAGCSWILGWRGVDLPAQVYRANLFHRNGLTLWDSQWYGGHWTLDYSVIFPLIAAVLGMTLTALLSATGAALAFDRVAVRHFGPVGRIGSVLFAAGTTVQLAIGQLPFLTGEAFALAACWAATRRRWSLAVVLSIATALSSPLAGAFLGLAVAAWLVAGAGPFVQRSLLALMLAGVALPVVITAVLFPGQGAFPYPAVDFAVELTVAVVFWALVRRQERVLRCAVVFYGLATVASFVITSPVGGNIGRLAECVAIPLGACVLWERRRLLFVVLAIPMALLQWTPAWGAIMSIQRDPSTQQAYYRPLLANLSEQPQPIGRLEVVPTRYHWDAAYVAPTIPLARGWERQLDIADNPLFYDTDELTAATYRAWLISNGIGYVALPDAPLDFAGVAEARLISSGVPGLIPIWTSAHWRVYSVSGSTGIVDGPARLTSLDGGHVQLEATGLGTVVVKVRYSPHWMVTSGKACIGRGPGDSVSVSVWGAGRVSMQLRLTASSSDQQAQCR